MSISRDNITSELSSDALNLEHRANMLVYHVNEKRVTHTVAAIIRCILSIGILCRKVQSDKNYVKLLEKTLKDAHEREGGSMEFQSYPDGTVFIKGSFYVGKLRDGLVTIPQANMTMTVEKANG